MARRSFFKEKCCDRNSNKNASKDREVVQLFQSHTSTLSCGDINYLPLVTEPANDRCVCSVAKLCPALCHPMDCGMPGLPVRHHPPEFAQVHVHWMGNTIPLSHFLSLTSPFPSSFLIQGSNLDFPHCRWTLYCLSHHGSPDCWKKPWYWGSDRHRIKKSLCEIIGLKFYWARPCPPEQDPVFRTASISHQEAYTSLLTSSIR